jgi:hypothetical protein
MLICMQIHSLEGKGEVFFFLEGGVGLTPNDSYSDTWPLTLNWGS